jgi:uncharacterized protein YdaU (DUF1376 family)
MTKIWKMGISPDNFISDTQDLTNEELGVYFRLLCYAWKKEAYLPKDRERLKRIGQNCEDKIMNYLLETFFIEDDQGFYCKAQKEEFDWVVEKSEKAKESAERRWNKQSERISERNANYSHSYSNNKHIDDLFEFIWQSIKVKRGTKANGLKAFKKIFKNKEVPEKDFIIKQFNLKCDTVSDKQYIPHFSTWLNSEGWTEELTSEEKSEFKLDNRNPFRNLTLWKKGIKTLNDNDADIRQAYKDGLLEKNHIEKLNISLQ